MIMSLMQGEGARPAARRWVITVALALLGMSLAAPLRGQMATVSNPLPGTSASGGCDYQRCALGIAPVWNGLAVVRGVDRDQVANLNFFWVRDVTAAFAGDSARAYAVRAVHTRRLAATLTDAGALLLAAAATRGVQVGRLDGGARVAALVGAGAFAVSVPLHFQADGWLSRAVWWHNAKAPR
jgi:hypothetical protein